MKNRFVMFVLLMIFWGIGGMVIFADSEPIRSVDIVRIFGVGFAMGASLVSAIHAWKQEKAEGKVI
ncbi:MAG: hypothetical protein GY805_37790 [Chloroflexi bacterium]|nr:hypothetical protein [Chloroflexota bacterium]